MFLKRLSVRCVEVASIDTRDASVAGMRTCTLDERLGDVEREDARAEPRHLSCELPVPARDVQHPLARPDVQQAPLRGRYQVAMKRVAPRPDVLVPEGRVRSQILPASSVIVAIV